jgi:hypothetical protein
MATVSRRYEELCEMGVRELAARLVFLELQLMLLHQAVRTTVLCGNLLDPTTSCQLLRDHAGCHTWQDPWSDMMIQWG